MALDVSVKVSIYNCRNRETNMGYQILINGRSAFGTTYGLSALQMTIRDAQSKSRNKNFDGDKIEVVNENHTKTFWSSKQETAQ